MGQMVGHLIEFFQVRWSKPYKILLLGLDGAGKTTVLYWVRLQSTVVTIPTIGMNVEEIRLPKIGVTFTAWDIGGQNKLRQLWSKFYEETKGLLFVIDSTDAERFPEASLALHQVLNDPNMVGVPFVLLINKQDLPNACKPHNLISPLRLSELEHDGHQYNIKSTVATIGEGLLEACGDLAKLIKQNKFKK